MKILRPTAIAMRYIDTSGKDLSIYRFTGGDQHNTNYHIENGIVKHFEFNVPSQGNGATFYTAVALDLVDTIVSTTSRNMTDFFEGSIVDKIVQNGIKVNINPQPQPMGICKVIHVF